MKKISFLALVALACLSYAADERLSFQTNGPWSPRTNIPVRWLGRYA